MNRRLDPSLYYCSTQFLVHCLVRAITVGDQCTLGWPPCNNEEGYFSWSGKGDSRKQLF